MVHKSTIYQILRKAGVIYTKNDADELFRSQKILVDGKLISGLDYQCNPKKATILINGIPLPKPITFHYFLLHKPVGYVTSKERDRDKKNVMELIHEPTEVMNSLFPVGRLDFNSSGLLIITNDGDFAQELLDPLNEIEKEYLVEIKGILSTEDIDNIKNGFVVSIRDLPYHTKPSEIYIKKEEKGNTTFTIILHEGKKRQIREMMKTLGHEVISLKRIRMGNLHLGNLAVGEYRTFDPELAVNSN